MSASLRPRSRARRPADLNPHLLESIRIWIGDVLVDICNMADYERISRICYQLAFFNHKGKEE
ncbi:MAG: hypothetical protein R6X27_05370 [Candidatus Desulfacyla sp.]